MTTLAPQYLDAPDGATIAYHSLAGKSPGVIFCGGFHSDMTGTKATALDAACRRNGRAYVRFDYLGHGDSSGDFADGTIGRWRDDALAVLDSVAQGPQILVGSSMGGWIAVLAALARPDRIAGLVGVAAAPDFTEDLMWQRFPQEIRDQIMTQGTYFRPSAYDDGPYPITRRLIEEGRNHLVLREPIALDLPVRLIHGMADLDVPWQQSLNLAEALTGSDVILELVKHGDHRLSKPDDLARLVATIEDLAQLSG